MTIQLCINDHQHSPGIHFSLSKPYKSPPHEPNHRVHICHSCLVSLKYLSSRIKIQGEPRAKLLNQFIVATCIKYVHIVPRYKHKRPKREYPFIHIHTKEARRTACVRQYVRHLRNIITCPESLLQQFLGFVGVNNESTAENRQAKQFNSNIYSKKTKE